MKLILLLCPLLAAAAALPFRANFIGGYRPTRYTSLDLSQVSSQSLRSSGHREYITVPDDDLSGEAEIYRLVGVAPPSSIKGGAATTYSAKIGKTVPVYSELDDVFEHKMVMNYMASRPTTRGAQRRPWTVRAEATLADGRFAVLLDD